MKTILIWIVAAVCVPAAAKPDSSAARLNQEAAFQEVNRIIQASAMPPQIKPSVAQYLKEGILTAYFKKRSEVLASDLQGLFALARAKTILDRRRKDFNSDGNMTTEETAQLKQLGQEYREKLEAIQDPSLKRAFFEAERKRREAQKPSQGSGSDVSAGASQKRSCLINWRPGKCFLQALAAREAGDDEQALADLNAELSQAPGNVQALNERASLYNDRGDYQAANADAKAVLEQNPKDPAAVAMYRLTEGRTSYAEPEDLGAGSSEAYDSLESVDGARALKTRLEGKMTSTQSLYARKALESGRQALKMNDMPAAIEHFRRAGAADPRLPEALKLLSMAYNRTGKYQEALQAADAGLALEPRDVPLLIAKAYALNRMKDYKGALEAAGLAKEISPQSADALANYAYAIGGLGDKAQMMRLLAQAARMDPRYVSSLESAQNMPSESDILFLFPGEPMPDSLRPRRESSPPSRRNQRFGVIAIAALIGGFLVALGLLQSVVRPLAGKVATILTASRRGEPALSVAAPVEESPRAVVPQKRQEPWDGLLRGQYKIVREMAVGGMGVVYEGDDVSLSRKVAIKKMRDELRLDRRERLRFVTEAKLVASLHHPNIVDIYAIIEEQDDIYLVFEYVSGKTIYEMIDKQGAFSFPQVLSVTRSMVSALEFAHSKNVIHRDLKPSNVMINDEGFVKVMDFGIARLAKDVATRLCMTNTVVGTPPYMSPEQEQGLIRKEADVYSLAICVYEMLCARPPFAGTGAGMLMNKVNMTYTPISHQMQGLPVGIDIVFDRAFNPDPDRRTRSARDFLTALESLHS